MAERLECVAERLPWPLPCRITNCALLLDLLVLDLLVLGLETR